jgi:hypothetical protein
LIFRKLHSEDKAGIYLTVILHLCVIIILLVIQIGKELSAESSFVMDFTKQEELEKQQAEAIQQEQWERAERLGDKLVDLESNSAFSKCFNCGKRSCPGYPDGIIAGEEF